MSDAKRPTLSSGVYYRDPRAAIAWLEEASGFEPTLVVINEDGTLGHSELRLGDGMIMVGKEWDAQHQSPASVRGVNTQQIHIQLETGIDDRYAQARKAGAKVMREIADQFYGDRTFIVADPEGHMWSFGQTLTLMTNEEMQAASPGIIVTERL